MYIFRINLAPIETFCPEEKDTVEEGLLILALGSVLIVCIIFGWRTIRRKQQ